MIIQTRQGDEVLLSISKEKYDELDDMIDYLWNNENLSSNMVEVLDKIDMLFEYSRYKNKQRNIESQKQKDKDLSQKGNLTEFKGLLYRLIYIGPTKYGRRAKLQSLDKKYDFWVNENKIYVLNEKAPEYVRHPFEYASEYYGYGYEYDEYDSYEDML